MRRPGVGPARRGGFRGFGGGAVTFNPLTDPDLLGLWVAKDATDNGTTLTVPDRSSAARNLTATGGTGRAAISATGLAGQRAIDFSAMVAGNVPLQNTALGATLSGQADLTALVLWGYGTTPAAGYVLQYGAATGSGEWRWLCRSPGAGQHSITWYGSGVNSVPVNSLNADVPPFEEVLAVTFDGGLGTHKVSQPYVDGTALPGTWTADGGPASFANKTFYVGSRSDGASPMKQMLGAVALVGRVLTAAEIVTWGKWLRQQYALSTTPKRVLHVGDSIVAAGATGWRARVWDLYTAAAAGGSIQRGYYQPVGNLGLGVGFVADYHSGVSGSRILTCQTRVLAADLLSGTAFRLPDVVHIAAGVNDIVLDAASAATVAASWETILTACYDQYPSARYVITSLINNTSGGGAFSATVDAANDLGPTAVANAIAARPGLQATWVDSIYTVPLSDGTHPTTGAGGGYEQMGDAYYPLIMGW